MKWYIRWGGTGCVAATLFATQDLTYALPPVVESQSLIVAEEDGEDSSIELGSEEESDLIATDVGFQSTTSVAYDQTAPVADPAAAKKAAAAKKKAAAELKKKVATAYKDPFYLNDFSYLKNPNYKGYNYGEKLKGMKIGDEGKLDLGGQYRMRYHGENNMRGLGLTGRDDNFLLERTRLYADYRITKRARVYAEILDANSSYENFAFRQIEENRWDMNNLFGDAVLVDGDAGKLTARLGRQEILFGSQRLLSPLDWANTRRRFDGGRLTWANDDQSTDFLLLRPENFNRVKFDSPNQNQVLYGIYHTAKQFKNPVDFYWLAFEDDLTTERIHTFGTAQKGDVDGFLWDNEFGYQLGRSANGSDVSATALTGGIGRRLSETMKPTIMFYYDYASGGTATDSGWNQLFPLGHKYLGFMDFFARRNIHDVNATFSLNPTEKFTMFAWYHYFTLANSDQGPYNITGTSFNPGGTVGSRDLGQELDLLGTYKVNARSDLVLGYSRFFTGDYYDTSTRANGAALFNGDANFYYAQWHYNF